MKSRILFLLIAAVFFVCNGVAQETGDSEKLQQNSTFQTALKMFDETSLLSEENENKTIYRIFKSSSIQDPYMVRVEKSGDEYTIFSKKLELAKNADVKGIKVGKPRKISAADWQKVEKLFADLNFSKLPELYKIKEIKVNEDLPSNTNLRITGTKVLAIIDTNSFMETVSEKKYHLIYRSNHSETGLWQIEKFLLKLSKLRADYHIR